MMDMMIEFLRREEVGIIVFDEDLSD